MLSSLIDARLLLYATAATAADGDDDDYHEFRVASCTRIFRIH